MVYRNQKESDDLLDKLVASTRSPHGPVSYTHLTLPTN